MRHVLIFLKAEHFGNSMMILISVLTLWGQTNKQTNKKTFVVAVFDQNVICSTAKSRFCNFVT